MADKEDDANSTTRSVSSGLSDSWSVVNTDGDLLITDDDSISTTSSVEVVDDDDADGDQQPQLTSLSTSPSLATPTKGPLFVLRLSSHDVSDTDDDQPSNTATDNITNSESFDVLSEQKQTKGDNSEQKQVMGDNSDVAQFKDKTPSPEIEEHIESLVKAISDVKTSYESSAASGNVNVTHAEPVMHGDKQSAETDTVGESEINPAQASTSSERLVESVGMKNKEDNAETESIEEHPSSEFSFINYDIEESTTRDSPDTSESTIMNQSMERSDNAGDQQPDNAGDQQPDNAGDQQMGDNVQTGEPSDENEEDNQPTVTVTRIISFGQRLVEWYNFLSDIFGNWRQGLSRDSIIAYMCVVFVILFMASTYTAYAVLVKKEKATRYVEEYQLVLDNFNDMHVQLKECLYSKAQLKYDISKMDSNCNLKVSFEEIDQLLQKWKYSSPASKVSDIEQLEAEAQYFCGTQDKNCNFEDKQHSLQRKIGQIALVLRQLIAENKDLEDSLKKSNLEISKLKETLQEADYKLAESELQIEKLSLMNDILQYKQDEQERNQANIDNEGHDTKSSQNEDGQETIQDENKSQKNVRKEAKDADFENKQDSSKDKDNKKDDGNGSDGTKETLDEEDKSQEEILFNQCLNVMVEYYKQKLNEKPKFEWFDYGSGLMREYLLGYLHDIIPENLQAFVRRLNTRETTLGDQDNQDQSTESTEHRTMDDNNDDDYKNNGDDDDRRSGFHKRWTENNDFENEKSDEKEENKKSSGYNERKGNTDREQEFDSSSAGRWTDSILDMMNKTRAQLQETWDQVKNASEKIWTRHEPAITRLQNTFKRKLQNLSTKFQEKLAKKARKWFNKSKKRSKQTEKKEENFAKTSRREERKAQDSVKPYCHQFSEMRDLVSKKMNVQKFRKSESSPNLIIRMKQLWKNDDIPKSSSIRKWLECQIDWWAKNENFPIVMPQYLVTEKCFDMLECWQIEVSEGDHGLGRRKCQILKTGKSFSDLFPDCKSSATDHHYSYDDNHEDADDYNDYDDHPEYDRDAEEMENWFLRRAELRDYEHSEPDDWYFRRYEKWSQDVTKKKKHSDCDEL